MIPELKPHPGPDIAPAAATGVGLWTDSCHRYRLRSDSDAAIGLVWPTALSGAVVGKDAVLEWATFPAYDHDATRWPDGFRACGTGIEVTFDDGSSTRVQALPELDGLSGDASARRMIDVPEQWNHRRLDLAAWAGRRIRDVWLLVAPGRAHGATGAELVGWVDGPRLAARTPLPDSPAERVIATRGSHSSPQRSRGLTQPLVGVPHGGCYLSPATRLDEQAWTYSWSAHSPGTGPELAGFLMTRAPSIWIGDRGALGVRIGRRLDADGRVAREAFSHDDERALPHRYTVDTASGVVLDGAAGSHAAVIEAAFPDEGFVQFTVPGGRIHSRTYRAPRLWLTVSTDNPFEPDLRAWYDIVLDGVDIEPVDPHGATPTFRILAQPGERLRIEIGTSFISAEQARHARRSVSGRRIEDVAADAELAWNEVLGVVDAPTATDDERRGLASDLYRLFCYPTAHHEQTPDGPRYADPIRRDAPDRPKETGRAVRAGRFLTDHGFWDTYRTCWPAFHLLAPARAGELIDGFLEHVRVSGWSPRWSAGAPLDAMVGTSFDIVTADAVASGIGGFDVRRAYAAALRNATCASTEARFGRADMPASLFRGYVESGVRESVSWTLEGAINDAGAAVLARNLARDATGADAARLRAEARYLAGRALAYAHLFDRGTRFFRPRDAARAFADAPFDPRVWGGGHTETNAWGSRFGVPHDGAGLARLLGGREAMGDALDALFAEPETGRPEFAGSYGHVIHEMSEARDLRLGMCGLSNQPAHHVPWMYAFTDRPWRAAEVTAEAVGRMFGGMHIGQGFPGDEDNGEMSAWHLLAQMGLLPLQVGSGEFLIGAPLLPEIVVRPIGAKPLVVRAVGTGGYVGGVRFNGERWHRPTIPTTALHRGGLLEVGLRRTPADWCEPMPTRPFFAPDDGEAMLWRDVLAEVQAGRFPGVSAPSVTDDVGGSIVQIADGDVLCLYLTEKVRRLIQLTVTLDRPGDHSFSVDVDGDTHWREVRRVADESWRWPGQTRVFDIAMPWASRVLLIHWSGAARLRQIQVLTSDRRR